MQEFAPDKSSQEVGRGAERFALCAYAGTLATEWKIMPWNEDEAYRSVGLCFHDWLQHRGGRGPSDIERGVRQVATLLAKYGTSRFEPLNTTSSETGRVNERWGWRT